MNFNVYCFILSKALEEWGKVKPLPVWCNPHAVVPDINIIAQMDKKGALVHYWGCSVHNPGNIDYKAFYDDLRQLKDNLNQIYFKAVIESAPKKMQCYMDICNKYRFKLMQQQLQQQCLSMLNFEDGISEHLENYNKWEMVYNVFCNAGSPYISDIQPCNNGLIFR